MAVACILSVAEARELETWAERLSAVQFKRARTLAFLLDDRAESGDFANAL
jgi:hypothetical protein